MPAVRRISGASPLHFKPQSRNEVIKPPPVTAEHLLHPADIWRDSFHVGFAEHLHITVLDAVVKHLHKVTRTTAGDPLATRFAFVGFGSNRLEDIGFNMFPSCLLYTSPSPRDRQKSRMPSSA